MNNIPEGISLEQAREILLSLPVNIKKEKISIAECTGRILAEDYYAPCMLPSFSKSPLDGYAFQSFDTASASKDSPVTLQIIEEIPAGKAPEKEVHSGEAAKILTGAPIPSGADAVIRFEDTSFTADTVTVFSPMKHDSNIIHAGEDIKKGELAAAAGTVLTPPCAGLMASLGIPDVEVYKKPRIALICTGSELVDVQEPLTPGKIHNSSLYTLSGYLTAAGAEMVSHDLADDTDEAIAASITKALPDTDMIITTGGVSVGDYDKVRGALESLGAEILFWRVAIKPGMALIAALLEGKLILGLSGNPGSAAVSLHLLGIPYVKKLSGRTDLLPQKIRAYTKEGFPKASHCDRYLRGLLAYDDGKVFFVQTGSQGNNIITSCINCSVLAKIPAGTASVQAGEILDVYII